MGICLEIVCSLKDNTSSNCPSRIIVKLEEQSKSKQEEPFLATRRFLSAFKGNNNTVLIPKPEGTCGEVFLKRNITEVSV